MSFESKWKEMYQPNKEHKPDYQTALGLLSHLNADELRELLNDEDKFENMIKDVKDLKELDTEKEMLMASNRSLAEFNLSKESHLLKGRQRLHQLCEEGEAIHNGVELKGKEILQKSGDQSSDTVLALLQTSAAEMEEESEAIAERFLDGELEVESFLDQFSMRRKLMHLRKVKSDKMTEMVNLRSSKANTGRNEISTHFSGHNYYPNIQPLHTPSIAPYPTGPVTAMPMPGMFLTSNHFS